MSGTPILFHGPEARNAALDRAGEGRPISDPIGDAGLKVEEARQIVEIAGGGTIGDAEPTLVVGPIDAATVNAADALLKTLEDLRGRVTLVLWARDDRDVIPTIRSRTRSVWCPATERTLDPVRPYVSDASDLVSHALSGDANGVLAIVQKHDRNLEMLLFALDRALVGVVDNVRAIQMWVGLRRVRRKPTVLGVVSAILGGMA